MDVMTPNLFLRTTAFFKRVTNFMEVKNIKMFQTSVNNTYD